MGLEMQNNAAEIKLRAERRAGEMLKRMEKAKGAAKKGWKTRSHDVTALSEVGVTKMQSSRWQSIAALPKKDFEGPRLPPQGQTDTQAICNDGQMGAENQNPAGFRDGLGSAFRREKTSFAQI